MIKNSIYMMKTAYSTIKNNKQMKFYTVVLWIMFLAYYVVRMFIPIINERLLNGAVSIFGGEIDYFSIGFSIVGFVVLAFFNYIYSANMPYIMEKLNTTIKNEIQSKINDKLCRIRYSLFNFPKIYNDINVINTEFPGYCANFLGGRVLTTILGTLISFIFTSWILIKVNIWVAVIMIGGNIFGYFKILIESRLNYYIAVGQMPERRQANAYADVITDRNFMKEIRLYGLLDYLVIKWKKKVTKINRKNIKYSVLYSFLDLVIYMISNSFLIAALIITVHLIIQGQVSPGAFLLVFSSSNSMIDTSGSLLHSFKDLRKSSYYADLHKTFENLEDIELETFELVDKYEPLDKIDIKFNNVVFAYEGAETNAIDGISVEIKQGEKVAVVGANGSGKSTFVSLINLLYQPCDGEIEINGTEISENIANVRRQIVTLFQDFGCYEFDVRDNILMGDTFRDVSDEELNNAAKIAGIDTFIKTLPNGLDTPIGRFEENGINLSGGQWQKLALARSLLRENSKVLIMDEPNAALDPKAEEEIYKNVFNNVHNQTLIMISHRLGAIKYVNRILLFDKGKIIDSGTHDELMQRSNLYNEMYTAQAEWYE